MKSHRSIIFIVLAAFAIAILPACTVSTASVDGVSTVPSESDDSPFFQPGVEGEDGIEVEVEDGDDSYVGDDVEDDDVAAQTASAPVEITTDPSTLLSTGDIGDYYEEEIKAQGGSEDSYDWSAEGLPSGIEIIPVFGGKRALIKGELGGSGTHEITVTASDPNDSSNADSISYQLEVGFLLGEVEPPENGPANTGKLRIEVLEVGNHSINGNRRGDKVNIGGSGIGGEEWVKMRVAGGKGPYTWLVISRVDDSFHRVNVGGGTPGLDQGVGITNYRYWNQNEICQPLEVKQLFPEEEEGFWPDCSPTSWINLSASQKLMCDELGCDHNGWYYLSDEMQEQCTNGFDCSSGLHWNSLTPAQKNACMEYQMYETMKTVKEKSEENWGKPIYDCKWTKNPTWRLQGMPAPNPPQDNSFGQQAEDNPPRTVFKTDGELNTFVAEMEYDGPLPVNKSKNMIDGKDNIDFMPVEKVTFRVMDSSPVPRMTSVEVDFSLVYPNENIEEIETKLLYRSLNVDWNCNDNCKLKLVLLRDKPEGDADWSDYENDALAISVFDLKELEQENWECVGYSITGENPLCKESMDITDLTGNAITDVGHVALHVFAGYHQETHSTADGAEWHYGDMNVEDISFNSKYYDLQYDDDDAGDLMNSDISKGSKGTYDLSDTEGIDKPNSRGGSFHRRDLIPSKWTY